VNSEALSRKSRVPVPWSRWWQLVCCCQAAYLDYGHAAFYA
jgi:hypothetical protein